MNHGNDDDDGLDLSHPMPGPSGMFAQLMGGFGGGRYARVTPASAYDDYFKAFSVATMTHGHERPQLMYGGKIIMPPSALAKLTSLDIDGPWTFQLRNPRNPIENNTHAGVLEFIAAEGVVHLPAWMMKTLALNEGDPIRLTGATLPKGKRVKIQAQSVDFLQVADAKAVLESALRAYSVLSAGDIIEITYNSLTFEFLIMETWPEGPGISIIDTDLEVDFETPVGYVEPPRPAPAPIPTMADKLKIDLGGTTLASTDSSRPVSSMSIRTTGSGEAALESFTGVGQSLSGKRVKGKGLAKKIEEVDATSKINRQTGPRVIKTDELNDDRKVPAALVLPEGKFFFGYKYVAFDADKVESKEAPAPAAGTAAFQGDGNSLRRGASNPNRALPAPAATLAAAPGTEDKPDPWAKLGAGNSLSGRTKAAPAPASARVPSPSPEPEVVDATMLDEDDFMFGENYDDDYDDYDDDDDEIIEIDSD